MDETNCTGDPDKLKLRSGQEVIASQVCNDHCDTSNCEDEANCNGYTYGLYCKYTEYGGVVNLQTYVRPRWICDDLEDCDGGEDEVNCTVPKRTKHTCKHGLSGFLINVDTGLIWAKEIPVFNYTRCDASIETCLDEDLKKFQTNCTDPARDGGTCFIDGYLSTVSKYAICYNRTAKICDDNIESRCLSISKTCLNIHKHFICDNVIDCEDESDELDTICLHQTSNNCQRKIGTRGELPLPLSWIGDGTQDCVDGSDELADWPTCGAGRTRRLVTSNTTCDNVFLCPWGEPGFVELTDLCDGRETCGNENQLCSLSRNSKDISDLVLSTEHGLVMHLSICIKGLKNIEELARVSCTKELFIFPNHDFFGVDGKTELHLLNSPQNCDHMYGEQYVFTSCSEKCRNSSCPLKNLPRHEVCPNQYPNRIATVANNEYLAFFTKSHGNIYTNRYFVCDNKIKCIEYSQVCDLVDDCGDGSDEISCTNHFECKSSGRLIPKTKMCDAQFDCFDMSDECNQECSKEILEGLLLKVISPLIGGLAILANLFVMTKKIRTLKHCMTSVALVNKSLVILISYGDFLVGCYLLIISIFDTAIFRRDYCRAQVEWKTSSTCSLIGVLSTIGSQVSLFAMTGLSLVRLHGILRPLKVPGEVNLMKSLKVAFGVLFIVLTSAAIAIIPIIGAFEDFFVNGVKFADELAIFIGTQNKRKILEVLEAYYGRMKQISLRWDVVLEIVSTMFSHDETYNDYTQTVTKLDFYGNDGVCLFKYFVAKDDPQKAFVWAILNINFICFLLISVSYILISIVSKDSSRNIAGAQNRIQINQRSRKINRRIGIIITTDFCSWVPFIFICALHSIGTLDATPWYSLFSMIILPINSVINPFLYDDVITAILRTAFRLITATTTHSPNFQSFIGYFSTTRTSIIEMKQRDNRRFGTASSSGGNLGTTDIGTKEPNKNNERGRNNLESYGSEGCAGLKNQSRHEGVEASSGFLEKNQTMM